MSFEVKVPPVGESISEAMISNWLVADGDFVKTEDILLELDTDKATVEIASETSGVIKILKKENENVKIGEIIALIDEKDISNVEDVRKVDNLKENEKIASPSAKNLIEKNNLDIDKIQGTGKADRVTKEDVINLLDKNVKKDLNSEKKDIDQNQTIKPMSTLRRAIASKLVEAQQTAAILTTFNEIDMTEVMSLRSKYKEMYKEKYGVSLGFMSFFTKAAIESLKEFPDINGWIEGNDIVYNHYYNIGIAVSSQKGLVVPVLKNAQNLDMHEIESQILKLAKKARDKKITIDDLSGGTFTISNGGVFGSMMSTPILNPPQSGILGLHKIEKRPVVIDDKIEIRPMMYIALSYDHRIVDGKEAVQFLVKIKQYIEQPVRLLLEI